MKIAGIATNPMISRHGTAFGGALLVAGTSIGGGMLALPVLTSPSGFFPSLALYLLCGLFMTLTGFLFLELSLHMEEGTNLISMAEKTLGLPGKIAAWALYLFLFYCLTVAYLVGCGDLLHETLRLTLPRSAGPLFFGLIFIPFVYAGPKVIGKFNYFLMGTLALCYLGFVALGAKEITPIRLLRQDWPAAIWALPIAFTAFAYQGIIPTLVTYLDRDKKKLQISLLLGTMIPFVTYAIWQALILGIVPYEEAGGLAEALSEGRNAVYPLKEFLNNHLVVSLGHYFAFFALLTSFFGVALGLVDFLADGLKVKKTRKGKLLLLSLIYIPTLFIAVQHPSIFLEALDYAGGYGCALLLGLLPILMVARQRKMHPEYPHLVKGGNLVLGALTLFVFFEVVVAYFAT
jgi:tyrosine-specific transport protein